MNFIEMLTKGMPEFKDVGNMTEKEMEKYAKELADACQVVYYCADAMISLYLMGIVGIEKECIDTTEYGKVHEVYDVQEGNHG